jgi:hypothetical protein
VTTGPSGSCRVTPPQQLVEHSAAGTVNGLPAAYIRTQCYYVSVTTVLAVLHEHDLATSESQVAAELRILLDASPVAATFTLTSGEDDFLAEHGGIPAASKRKLESLDARSAARAVLEAAESLSRAQAAELLNVDESRISHRVRDGSLYSYPGASGRRRYPNWQFPGSKALPHLADVLARVPHGTHPVTLRTFMMTPDDALLLDERLVSPVEWLAAGGPAAPVAALAATLGEQV